jgi:hypothetical protein
MGVIGATSGTPPSVSRPKGSRAVFLTFNGLREAKVRDRDTRIGIALQGPQAARLSRLAREQMPWQDKRARAHFLDGVYCMFDPRPIDPTPIETSFADHRQRIWLSYIKGELAVQDATVQLLRLDIDRIDRARERTMRNEPLRTGWRKGRQLHPQQSPAKQRLCPPGWVRRAVSTRICSI